MSKVSTWSQATDYLKIIDDQNLNLDEIQSMRPYVSALAAGVKTGTLPDINTFRAIMEGRAEIVVKQPKILSKIMTISVGEASAKDTADCFTEESRYSYRDGDIDSWLSHKQSVGAEKQFDVWGLEKESTFAEIARAILEKPEAELDELAKDLIEGRHTVTLTQIEELIERTERGETIGLRTDSWGNFFFVQNGEGGVSVVRVARDGRRWRVLVRRLDSDVRWHVGFRFFSRNLGTVSV